MTTTEPTPERDLCLSSKRQDKVGAHSWGFDGDDPYVICHYCGEVRDAISGGLIRKGKS